MESSGYRSTHTSSELDIDSLPYHYHQLHRAFSRLEDPTALKILVAPSASAALELRLSIAHSGEAMVNLEALTPGGLARHIVHVCHPHRIFRTIDGFAGQVLLERLAEETDLELKDLMRRSCASLFESIQELGRHGINPVEVERAAHYPHERDLARMAKAQAAWLESHDVLDETRMMALAREEVDTFLQSRPVCMLLVLDEVRLSAAEADLLGQIASSAGQYFRIGPLTEDLPEDRAGSILAEWPILDVDSARATSQMPATPGVLQASDRTEEVRMVLADILDRNDPFDRIEIVYQGPEPYIAELRSASERYGIPMDFGGRPLSRTRLGSSVRSALHWISEGGTLGGLADLIQTGSLGGPSLGALSVLRAGPVSMDIRQQDRLDRAVRRRAFENRLDEASVEEALNFIGEFRSFVPDGSVPSGQALDAFLGEWVRLIDPENREPVAQREAIQGLFSGPVFEGPISIGLSRLAALAVGVMDRIRVTEEPTCKGAIRVVGFKEAGFGVHVRRYFLGMDDQASREMERSDSILTDAFRNRISGQSGVRIPAVETESPVRRIRGLLPSGDVILSAPAYEVSTGRTLYPGSVLIDLCGLEDIAPGRAARLLDRSDALRAEGGKLSPERVEALFPDAARARTAVAARRKRGWTEWDGVVAFVDPPRDHLSPSTLELIAACPYKYFLSRVLRIAIPPQGREAAWLEPHEEGRMLHQIFEEQTNLRLKGEGGLEQVHLHRAQRQVDVLLEDHVRIAGDPGMPVLEATSRRLKAAVCIYFDAERRLADQRTPVAAEFRFGAGGNCEAPGVSVPVDGGSLHLVGRVDRIDRVADGTLAITDFKTGSGRSYDPESLKKLDTRLQWAIYAYAIARHFGEEVSASGYLFTSGNEIGQRHEARPLPGEEVEQLVNRLLGFHREGFFPQAVDSHCRWCDFKAVCGDLDLRKEQVVDKICSSSPIDLGGQVKRWTYAEGKCS